MVGRETFTLASGQSLSGELDLRTWRLVGVVLPSAWTAADLTFQASVKATAEGGNYGEVFLDPGTGTGVALQLDAAASQATFLSVAASVGGTFIKVRSGTSGAPVVQAADRVITLILAPMV